MINKKKGPVVLVILDGWGEWDIALGNAVMQAKLPTIDKLNEQYPKLLLQASGLSVGLPWGVYGNSEVGHQTIGTGQILFQYLPMINLAIQNGDLEKNNKLINIIHKLKISNKALHLWGLCSDGGVHAHLDHLLVILKILQKHNLKKVYIHFVTDGRDTEPQIALEHLKILKSMMQETKVGVIATIGGRYFAMDRNNNWDRIEKAYQAMVCGEGLKANSAEEAIQLQYNQKKTDEYLLPTVITDEQGQAVGPIEPGDAVFCFNYRKDRARQLTKAFILKNFSEFQTKSKLIVDYVCMAEYEQGLGDIILFPPPKIKTRVGEILAKNNLKQLRIAEMEKFAHITYFFNGGNNEAFPGEERILVPSKECESYAKFPEMSAWEVTEKLLQAIQSEKYDFILVNYANSDMVGHTGNFKAGVKACETVDGCLAKLIDSVFAKQGKLIITADHGNIEEMINTSTMQIDTEHSTNPVPCWFVDQAIKKQNLTFRNDYQVAGVIADIAPTLLELLNLEIPPEMDGVSLLRLFNRI